MRSWTQNRTMDISNWGAALLIDIVPACRAAYLLWRKSEQKERKGQPEQEKEGEAESENNKRMKKRGIEAGTSLLSVPNEEKRAGIIIKKPH